MPNVSDTLRKAAAILQASGIAEPRREANSLLAFALKKNQTFLIAHSEYELNKDEETLFKSLLDRRAQREPFQHITGKQEFYGLEFTVSPDVLIPRPETELIVENAIAALKGKTNPRFCEIGVGSGCISVSILHEAKTATAIGVDVSEKALAIAKINAENNKVADRLELKISDIFAALPIEKFDLLVSNPPYIPVGEVENLQAEVRDFEPRAALTDGQNGLSIIENIINDAPRFLKPASFLLMEIGVEQAGEVQEMFSPETWENVRILPDLQSIPRMVKAELKSL